VSSFSNGFLKRESLELRVGAVQRQKHRELGGGNSCMRLYTNMGIDDGPEPGSNITLASVLGNPKPSQAAGTVKLREPRQFFGDDSIELGFGLSAVQENSAYEEAGGCGDTGFFAVLLIASHPEFAVSRGDAGFE